MLNFLHQLFQECLCSVTNARIRDFEWSMQISNFTTYYSVHESDNLYHCPCLLDSEKEGRFLTNTLSTIQMLLKLHKIFKDLTF